MKNLILLLCIGLTGCATNDYASYVEAHKAVSKDLTMSEIACYNSVAEGIKSGDNTMKTAAIALIAQCKKQTTVIEPPKKGLLGL